MGKKIAIILSSADGVGNNNNKQFYVDWNAALKDNQEYLVGFTYVTQGVNSITPTVSDKLAAILSVSFLQSNVSNSGSNLVGAYTSGALGVVPVRPFSLVNNACILYADLMTNSPTYMAKRPLDNSFTVRITDNTAARALWVDQSSNVPTGYVLTLIFEEI